MTSNTSRPNSFLKEQRELRNWTLNDVANELDQLCDDDEVSERGIINAQMVSGWERGKHLPSKLWRTKLCELYGKSPLELGFTQRISSQVTSSQEETLGPGTESDEDVNRREATKRIAALFGTALLMTPHELLNPQSLEQLSRALVKPAHLDTELLSHFQDITESCWHLMMRGELEISEHTLWGYLPRLVALAKQASQLQGTVAGIASRGYLLAASLAGHREDLQARERYCEQALLYSNVAHDRNLHVSALKQLALTFEYKERPGKVLQTYQQAIPYLNDISPLLRSRMYAGLAGAHAQCGQKLGGQMHEALDALALAYESFPERPQDDPSFLYADCDFFTIILWDGLVHLDLDQPKEAQKALARIDGLHPTVHLPEKVRIEFLNYQSETFTRLGDLDKARTYLEEAVNASVALGSERRYNESFEVYKQMRFVWRNEPQIKALGSLFVR